MILKHIQHADLLDRHRALKRAARQFAPVPSRLFQSSPVDQPFQV